MSSDRIRIMIAEDHGLVRLTLRDRLVGEPDFDVVATATTAEEAIEGALCNRPDILLLDIDLAGVSSVDAAMQIMQASAATRIIFVSAFSHDRYIDDARRLNVHGYVTKLERLDTLIEAIRTVSKGQRYYSGEIIKRLVPAKGGNEKTGVAFPQTRSTTLTKRQRQILTLIAQGYTKKQMAGILAVSVKTVESHCEILMKRLDLRDRVGLTRYAVREDVVKL